MYQYTIPQPHRYDYTTSATTSPSNSPPPGEAYYYRTQYATPTRKPAKQHSRHASYSSPREQPAWYSPAGYPSPSFYANLPEHYASNQDHVSNFDRVRVRTRRVSTSGHRGSGDAHIRETLQSPPQRIIIDTSDEAEDSPTYTYIKPRTGSQHKKKTAKADQYFFSRQVPVYANPSDSQPQRSRARRSSQSAKSRPTTTGPAKPPPPVREATPADAAKAGIPAGYSIKNWDPAESPVLVLGSVFDANSLGKWIYDWTVFRNGPATPISEVAGDLWLLLIKLAGKMKRAQECVPRIRSRDNLDMVDDFIESGQRLWSRLKKLLKVCEEFMWRAAKREGSKGAVKMGKNSGCEFVDTIFGRDRELENTESLMQSIRLWNHRFDANCEDILRRPSAA